MSIIPKSQEAETEKTVARPAKAKSSRDPISTNKSWVWWYAFVISGTQEV
jgi:hypothetical protein